MITVLAGGETFVVEPGQPLVFGRAGTAGVLGLDSRDMGISAQAGSIEFDGRVCWVINRSRKRHLLIEVAPGTSPHRLDCGNRYAITVSPLAVLVPGAVYTHRLEVCVPEELTGALRVVPAPPTGTITFGEVPLSDRDRDALAALFAGYLRPFPRRDPHPASYREAADLLGPPWTTVTLRKLIERLKARFAHVGLFFEGAHANDELAKHVIASGLIDARDLGRLPPKGER